MTDTISLAPIGFVENQFTSYAPSDEMRPHPSRIVVRPDMEPGLMGLAEGDHILVLFYFHRSQTYELQLHPGHDPSRPVRGVFATRSQYRPNSLGATVAQIKSVEGNIISVVGLDAQDGSPVLDIKPYSGDFDTPNGQNTS